MAPPASGPGAWWVHSCVPAGKVDPQAREGLRTTVSVCDAMLRQGITPDIASYSFLTSTCAKGEEPLVAVNVCDATLRQDIEPNIVT